MQKYQEGQPGDRLTAFQTAAYFPCSEFPVFLFQPVVKLQLEIQERQQKHLELIGITRDSSVGNDFLNKDFIFPIGSAREASIGKEKDDGKRIYRKDTENQSNDQGHQHH
jgi:hypothetical protein